MWCCFYNIIPLLFTRNGDSYAEARQYYSVSDGGTGQRTLGMGRLIIPICFFNALHL